ncbi:MAG: hypothetical protein G01um101448_517 [Parcubacteria group bacterium Gr01-1014_48]|nr:MAG: hypothetical protein Greene041614_187 [Parcubacteria group bacterium Greene0416_14]TSC73828.1 MAG: hypothetical protein G01um101448_517 [Parcubacteria group bacterium Gr01-1014_48]TSD01209.1 MAG: hypothetical protein Greene101415_404 [Parcubacteria group bacterium Greene1014_15]TSD07315.1 MAG: hypothetical protein Greene07144_948 [Parcubacteria group bacterium Greene0714_4]
MHMPFSVRCSERGHSNRPAKNTRVGILLVLTGEFRSCRGCGVEFTQIRVPNRPIVTQIATTTSVTAIVTIVEYCGTVPKAIGLA